YIYGEKILLSVTYFHMMFRSLINAVYNPATFTTAAYENTSKAHSHGIETGALIRPIKNLTLKGSYTYDYTKDHDTDTYLLRRPLHKFKINTFWEIVPKWDVNIEIRYDGMRLDWGSDKLKSYAVVNLASNYKIMKNLNVFMRIENMFDKRYEEARGFGTSPFAVYVGTKAEF
ncbi:MAG: TonB-dependent receptor, partial [Candidatus Omnitrophota bacterium]